MNEAGGIGVKLEASGFGAFKKRMEAGAKAMGKAARSAKGAASSLNGVKNPAKGAGQGIDKAAGAAGRAQSSFRRVSKAIGPMADKLKSVGRSLSLYVTAPLTVMGGASVKAFSDFDSAMTQSLAIMDDVSGAMRTDMAEAAREVSRQTTTSSTKAAESYFYLASAGLDAKESIGALPNVARFAQAGMFDMATATDLATDAQSALGLTMENAEANTRQMARVMDVLVNANQDANATVEQFSEALTNSAGAALRSVNKSVEEGIGVLAAFADQGTKGQKAGERLSQMLRYMSKSAAENTAEFQRLGLVDAQGNLASMADIVEGLTGELGGLSDVQKSARLEQLGFNARIQQAIKPLLGTSDAIREYTASAKEAGGSVEEVANSQMQSFSAQMQLARNAVQNAAQEIGEVMAPIVGRLASVVRTATNAFSAMPKPVKAFVVGVGALAAAVGPLLIALGSLPAIASAVAGGLTILSGTVLPALSSAFTTAWAAATGPVGAVVAGVAAVGASAYALYRNWEGMSAFFSDLWESVLGVMRGFAKASLGVLTGLWPAAKSVFLKGIQGLIGPLKRFAEWLGADSLASGISGFQDQLGGLVPREQMQAAANVVREGVSEMAVGVMEGRGKIMNAGKGMVEAATSVATRVREQFAGGVPETLSEETSGSFGGGGTRPNSGSPSGGAGRSASALSGLGGALEGVRESMPTMGHKEMAEGMGLSGLADSIAKGWEEAAQRTGIAIDKLKGMTPGAVANMVQTREKMAAAGARIGRVVTQGFRQAAAGMLEGIGRMAAGQASLGDVVGGVLKTLADLAIRVGKIAIGVGISVKGIKDALTTLNPAVAIAAGAALIALGGAAKAALSDAAGSGSTATADTRRPAFGGYQRRDNTGGVQSGVREMAKAQRETNRHLIEGQKQTNERLRAVETATREEKAVTEAEARNQQRRANRASQRRDPKTV